MKTTSPNFVASLPSLLVMTALLTAGPAGAGTIIGHTNVDGVAALPQATMDAIGQQKWLFTHASVGGNMIEGMLALHSATPGRYQLVTATAGTGSSVSAPPASTVPGTIYDANRGNPGWSQKFTIFNTAVRTNGWRMPKVGMVMDKLCFIDQDANPTNYVTMMSALEADFPATVFVYCTIPLESSANSANILRAGYNNYVRAHCQNGNHLLFDIADIESHDPAGNAITFTNASKVYQRLYDGYTSDGGHLNTLGEQRVALGWYATAAALVSSAPGPQWTTNSLPPGCIAWWPGDMNAADVVGGHDGTLAGDTAFAPARVGNGFLFDGTNDSVTIPHDAALNVPSTGFTVEFWMKAGKDQPDAIASIVDKDHSAVDATGWEVSCWRATGRLSFGIGDGSTFPLCTNRTDVLNDQLHHVAFAWDRTNWLIYVDGVLENSLHRPTVANNTRPLRFGYHWGDGSDTPMRFFRGLLDEVRIYNRALSGREIAFVYSGIPALDIARTNDQITVSWPAPAASWMLERTNALPAVAVASWPQVPPPYQTNAGVISVTFTNSPATGNQFFRLHKP